MKITRRQLRRIIAENLSADEKLKGMIQSGEIEQVRHAADLAEAMELDITAIIRSDASLMSSIAGMVEEMIDLDVVVDAAVSDAMDKVQKKFGSQVGDNEAKWFEELSGPLYEMLSKYAMEEFLQKEFGVVPEE